MLTKLSLVLIVLINLTQNSFGCEKKHFGNLDSFVCVCNSQHCDTLDAGPSSVAGSLTVYTTDAKAERLQKAVIPESNFNPNDDSGDIHITIDKSKRYQAINGFGGAFTDSSGININKLSPALKNRLIADYFGADGAHYNLARVPIAGTDFSTHCYTYDDVANDSELRNFALAKEDFDYKIPYIKKALALNADLKLFASPWGPPGWLKTNNNTMGSGVLNGKPGSLYWKTWANYFVKFFDSYRQQGIEFWGLTPQNEPLTGLMPSYRFNTLGFSGESMRDFIKTDLGPALQNAGYGKEKVKMLIYDHNTDKIVSFASAVLSDAEAAKYVSGVAYHWYDGLYPQNLDEMHNKYPNYFLISTESANGFGGLGSWKHAELYAVDMIDGLNHWSTGWVDWNLVLDPNGGPSYVNSVVDAPIIVSSNGSEYYKQPMFYALAHFSKFLKRGSVRVGQNVDQSNVDGVHLTTFLTPLNEMTIIVINTNDKPVKITLNGVTANKFTFEINGKSLKTIVKKL